MELKTYVAQDANGVVMPGAQALLLVDGTETPATGLTDKNGNAISNPMTTDANGVLSFKAPDGIYQLQFSLGPLVGPRISIQLLDLQGQKDAVQVLVNEGNDTLARVQMLVLGRIYETLGAAILDTVNVPIGGYFAVPAAAGGQSGAFSYYMMRADANGNRTPGVVTTIPTAAQTATVIQQQDGKLDAVKFNAVIQSSDPVAGSTDLLYCVRDSKGFQTWLGVRSLDGGPSAHAERLLRERLGMTVRANFLADGEEIAWAVVDKNGVLTDLAIRAIDGQLADYAVKRMSARMLATVNANIAAQLNPLTIGRDAPGFQVLASLTRWAAMRGRGESLSGPINFATPTNNQNARLTFPTPYAQDDPMLLVIYFGGVGSGPTLTPPPEYAAANNDGIIWARCNFEGDHYGSPRCMQDVAEVYATACKQAPVGGVVLLGNSMGGMGALNALLTKAVPGVLGLYLTDPVCNLWDRYNSSRQSLIQAAYDINSNGSNYSTQTAGYDPVLRHWSDFRGVPVYCIASSGDDLVPFATNAKQLYDTFSGHLDFTLVDKGTAGHNAADRFDPTALRNFLRKAASGKILK